MSRGPSWVRIIKPYIIRVSGSESMSYHSLAHPLFSEETEVQRWAVTYSKWQSTGDSAPSCCFPSEVQSSLTCALVTAAQQELQADQGGWGGALCGRRRKRGWPASEAHNCYPTFLGLPASTLLGSAVLGALVRGFRASLMGSCPYA